MSKYSFGQGIPTWNGVPMVGGIPITDGTYYFVNYGTGSDGNKGTSIDKPFKTLDKANDSVTTNKNDVVCLMGNTGHALTEMLTVAKNRVHFVGIDGTGGRPMGANARITMGVTTVATDIAAVKNTGIRNSFHNIKFDSGNTKAESLYTVAEAGEYAKYTSCEFYKSTDTTETSAAELAMNGNNASFDDCTFGTNVLGISAAIVRPCVMLTRELVSGEYCVDSLFRNCRFWRYAGGTTNAFVWWTSATDIEGPLEFRDCSFIATARSVATPAVAIGGTHALTIGEVLLTGTSFQHGCTAFGTATGIYSALPSYAAAGGYGIQATT